MNEPETYVPSSLRIEEETKRELGESWHRIVTYAVGSHVDPNGPFEMVTVPDRELSHLLEFIPEVGGWVEHLGRKYVILQFKADGTQIIMYAWNSKLRWWERYH